MSHIDKIGYYRGNAISEMNREELLNLVEYLGKRMSKLEVIEGETQDIRIDREINLMK